MQITVIDVGAPNTHAAKNGRSYQSMEVTYKNEQGQTQSKKLMSFSNPDVFKQAKDWQKGDNVNVNMTKDDAGYWQWVSIGEPGSASASPPQAYSGKPQASATRVTGSNYETPEERAKKQVYIVRQSSISSAIDLLKSNDNDVKVENVLSVAKQLEEYVFGKQAGVDAINNMQDDIPV
jgi:hypothetical protein